MRRIVFKSKTIFGPQFQIQIRVGRGLFSRWRGTHLCSSLTEAEKIMEYLEESYPYEDGQVVG